MAIEVRLPDTGMGITEATIVRWCKAVGDAVARGEIIAEVETAKANVDVESPVDGTLQDLLFEPGTTVDADAVIARIS